MNRLIFLIFLMPVLGFSQSLPNVAFPTSEPTADTYTVNITNYGTSYNDKVALINFRTPNGGPATLNITSTGGSALGAKPLRKYNGTDWVPLASGDITGDSSLFIVHYSSACGCLRMLRTGSDAGSVDLTSDVTGVLPVANGGTGSSTSTGSGNSVLSDSPLLTGVPNAPTQPFNSATSTIATTAYSDVASIYIPVNIYTSSQVMALTDVGKEVRMNSASPTTFTIPPNSSVSFLPNTTVRVTNYGSGQCTLTPGSGVTFRNYSVSLVLDQYQTVYIKRIASDEWIIWINGASSAGGVTSISTTSPITGGTITSTGTIGINQSTTSTDGYLSSTDWNTFNGKQDDLGYVPLSPSNNLSDVSSPSTSLQNIGGLEKTMTFNTQTGDYTLQVSDFLVATTLFANSSTNRVITIPANSTAAIPIGRTLLGRRIGTASITFTQDGGVSVTSAGGSNNDPGRYYLWALTKTGTDSWYLDNGGPALGTANQLFAVDNAGTGQEYKTVSNGLTAGSGTVQWGGAITSDRSLTGAFSIGFGASPSSKFHVTGLGTTTGSLFRLSDNSATTRLDILDNGKSTWNTSVSGASLTDYQWNPSWTASANSQTHDYFDLNMTSSVGAFTGSVLNFFRLRDQANTYLSMSSSAGEAHDGMLVYDFKFGSSTSIIRNSAGPLSIRGGTTSSTRMLQFTTVNQSSVNNNVSFNWTGTIHNLGTAQTRTFNAFLEDWAVNSVNGSTITYIGHNVTPSFTVGTSTLDYTFLDYNPSITAGTTTHIAMKIRSGLSGFGTAAPASTLETGASFGAAITSTSSDITLDATHHTVKVDASSAGRTETLPAASGCARRIYIIKKIDSSGNTVTVDGNASETIDGATTYVLSAQWKYVTIQSDGSNWMVIGNN